MRLLDHFSPGALVSGPARDFDGAGPADGPFVSVL
jgi:hypothetical protein